MGRSFNGLSQSLHPATCYIFEFKRVEHAPSAHQQAIPTWFGAVSPLARADNIEAPPQIPATNAATASLSGVKCVLRAKNRQTKFRQGETIRLVASFTSERPGYQINRLVQRNRGMAKLGDIRISPATGFTDPPGEFPEPDGFAASPTNICARTDRAPLVVNYSGGEREFWSVERYDGRGLAGLRAKLAQFPRESEFFWQMTSSRGPEAIATFESTRKWATKRGLKVEPYEKIGARRKALGLN